MITISVARAVSSSEQKTPGEVLPLLRPLEARQSLTHECVEQLKAQILTGKLAPGARLPTEQEMIAAMGVSRTVVREAVAALRAEGLLETRQGVGAFVANNTRRAFRIELDGLESIGEVIQVMELRTGVEIEAAGLAAERATTADVRKIAEAYDAIDVAIEAGDSGVDQDFALHCSIAEATGNPKFLRFLEYLGRFIIPRQTVNLASGGVSRTVYFRTFQKEHRVILDAIRSGAVVEARAAMRRHLLNSRKRYQKLAEQLRDR
jgi:GntR family transcriptional regulator, transcriptional repressor for pyruvate dehydrogenase complex